MMCLGGFPGECGLRVWRVDKGGVGVFYTVTYTYIYTYFPLVGDFVWGVAVSMRIYSYMRSF